MLFASISFASASLAVSTSALALHLLFSTHMASVVQVVREVVLRCTLSGIAPFFFRFLFVNRLVRNDCLLLFVETYTTLKIRAFTGSLVLSFLFQRPFGYGIQQWVFVKKVHLCGS